MTTRGIARVAILLAAGVVLLLLPGGPAASPGGRWVVRDLGVSVAYWSGDGGLYVNPGDVSINEHGLVVGTAADGRHYRAFVWDRGRLTYLGVLAGDTDSRVVGVNSRGQVVGVSWKSSETFASGHAFLWENGRMRDLGIVSGGDASAPVDINARGKVAGTVTQGPDVPYRAVLWEKGRLRVLALPPGRSTSETTAINDQGQVVGNSFDNQDFQSSVAFLWQNGKTQSLGTLPGYNGSRAIDINGRGQVVGELLNSSGQGGFFLWQRGKMKAIRLNPAYAWDTFATNDRGQVAFAGSNEWVLWQQGKSNYHGTGEPTALNERGQITTADWNGVARIWEKGKTTRLPLLPGDEGGAAIALNEHNQVVGVSGTLDADYSGAMANYTWNTHIVLWTWNTASAST